MNREFNLSVDSLFDCFFNETSEFRKKFVIARKFSNVKTGDWNSSNSRQLEYNVDLGTFGCPKNTEEQVDFND